MDRLAHRPRLSSLQARRTENVTINGRKSSLSYDSMKPGALPTAMSVSDGDGAPPQTCVLSGGNYTPPRKRSRSRLPRIPRHSKPEITPPAEKPNSTGRRTALAEWLTREDNPLTARVIVNRLWQEHFGLGIVATPNDFGAMGGNPSHPELLDWLACELISDGWHLKPLQRLMVLSATYCQSSKIDPASSEHAAALTADSANNLLWHARRQRLEGEEIRDTQLQISGELNPPVYGPSASQNCRKFSKIPNTAGTPTKNPSIATAAPFMFSPSATCRLPLLASYDQPDMQNSCPRRTNTTTAPQALEMLNGEFTEEAARHWSGKLLAECDAQGKLDENKLVREAYTEAFGRQPQDSEIQSAEKFVDQETAAIAEESTPPADKQLPLPLPAKVNRAKAAAIVDFCHALMCSNEFLYVD